ncbi:MAG: preprotein translocase subunit YajC [Acidobacteriota bacterium]
MTSSLFVLAQEAQSPFMAFMPMLLIFGIFYLILFMPMRKKQKALQELIANLKKGDKVYTNGGIYGEVSGDQGSTLILKVADNVKIRVARSAIAGLEGQEEGQKK